MRRSILSAGILGFAAAALLAAAPFWVEKPYTEWSQKELSKLLTDSPWVRSATVDFDPSAMRNGGPGGGMGGPGGGMGAPGGGMGGPGGGMGAPGGGIGGPGGGMPSFDLTVMWRSALLIRQAMYQAAVLQESPAAEALERALAEEPAHHILAVNGLPAMGGPGMRGPGMGSPDGQAPRDSQPPMSEKQRQEMRSQMEARQLASTTLKIGDEVIAAERMEMVQSGANRIVLFYFPKSRNLEASEKEARFETRMGPLKVAARFKPKDMAFAGKPKP